MDPEVQPETPRLSADIAKNILTKSPLHAWNKHRLFGGKKRKDTPALLKGKVVDALVFDQPVPDCPEKMLEESRKIADAVRAEIKGRAITGAAQVKLRWTNKLGVNCSGVLDLLDEHTGYFWDLKTSSDLSDWNIRNQIEKLGYDIQYAAYAEAIHTLYPDKACIGEFIFVETEEPYDVRFVSLTGAMKRNGQELWTKAGLLWKQCLETDTWPGRGDFVADVSPYRKKAETEAWLNQE